MANNLNASVQTLAGGAGPGAWTDVRLYGTPSTIAYVGAIGDVVRVDTSSDGVRAVVGEPFQLTTLSGGERCYALFDAANYVRVEVVSGNALASATTTITGAPLDAVKPTVAITVPNTTTPGAYADCRALQGPRTLLYQGATSADVVYFEGSDDGATDPYQIYPEDGTSRTGQSLAVTLQTLPNYIRCTRLTGSTAATAAVVEAVGLGGGGGGGSSGAQRWDALAVGNTLAAGPLGGLAATASVDRFSVFIAAQTTAAIIATLPNPSVATAARLALVSNTGAGATQTLYMYGRAIIVGGAAWFFWNGTAWGSENSLANGGNSGPVAMGSLDSTTGLIANGTQWAGDTGTVTTLGRSAGAAELVAQSGAGGLSVLSHAGGVVSVIADGSLTLDTTGTTSINVGTDPHGKHIFIGNATDDTSVEVNTGTGDCSVTTNGGDLSLSTTAGGALLLNGYTWPSTAPTYPGEPLTGDATKALAFVHEAATIRTTTFAAFTQPAVGATVDLTVGATTEMSVGQTLYVPGGGTYSITALPGGLVVRVLNRYSFNTAAAATIATGTLAQMPEGRGTLSPASGTLVVAWANLTATPVIEVTRYLGGGAVGAASLSITVNAGVGFTITSSQGTDGADVSWRITRE